MTSLLADSSAAIESSDQFTNGFAFLCHSDLSSQNDFGINSCEDSSIGAPSKQTSILSAVPLEDSKIENFPVSVDFSSTSTCTMPHSSPTQLQSFREVSETFLDGQPNRLKLSNIGRDFSKLMETARAGELEDLDSFEEASSSSCKEHKVFEIPVFREVDPTLLASLPEAWCMPSHYIRKQELLKDDWDDVNEYELDADDRAWLESSDSFEKGNPMTETAFELVVDRFEKEYYTLLEQEEKLLSSSRENTEPVFRVPNKRRRSSNPLSPAALTERAKENVMLHRMTFPPPFSSVEQIALIGDYWTRKRDIVRARHEETVQQLMKAPLATYKQPELFPLASLNAHTSLLLNYGLDCRPYYTVCEHLFLIPRLQEEYKAFHNLNVSLFNRRLSRAQLDTADGLSALTSVRQHLEVARLILDRILAREKVKAKIAHLSTAIFDRQLVSKSTKD